MLTYKVTVNEDGTIRWYLGDILHREDGPAVEYANGHKEWWLHGKRHRVDGPAVEYANGNKYWWLHGYLHREDGPAIERANGDKEWWLHGKLYRMDGPAIERANGDKEWYLHDKLHREDGPAVEWANGDKEWWLHGECLTKEEFNKQMSSTSCEDKVIEIDGTQRRKTMGLYFCKRIARGKEMDFDTAEDRLQYMQQKGGVFEVWEPRLERHSAITDMVGEEVRICGLGTVEDEICILSGQRATGYIESQNLKGEMLPCKLSLLGEAGLGNMAKVPKEYQATPIL